MSAATFTYDVSTVARVDIHKVRVGEVSTALLSDARQGAASRLTWARGTSTTPSRSFVATEAESGLVTAGETCNSFEHDTDVLMADGTRKPIDHVKVGDSVIATDPATGKTGPHAVTALIRHRTDHAIIDVSVATADGVETIVATDHHPFYVTSDGAKWVDAGDLVVGDELRSPDGTERVIVGVSRHWGHETVYNLTIEGVHTYYVGSDDPVLVHNSACVPDSSDLGAIVQRGARTTTDFDAVAERLGNNGLTRELASERLHAIKAGIENNRDVIFTWSGDVFDATSGDLLGNLLQG